MTGADNQQERLSISAIPSDLGSFLSGFAMGEASFMLVCRPRDDYRRSWKISAAFNVSQNDKAPLELFMETLRCGSIRKAGSGGWYWEVNDISEINSKITPFFERFEMVGEKQSYFNRFKKAVSILSRKVKSESDFIEVLTLREGMNRGGKRRYTMESILRDYTPNSV